MKKHFFSRFTALTASMFLLGSLTACKEDSTPGNQGKEPLPPVEYEGILLNKLIDAGYRTDNSAGAGNYEVLVGNTTSLMWEGDMILYLDFYNDPDTDPVNAILPEGKYEANTDYSPFTYNVSNSYAQLFSEDGESNPSPIMGEVIVEREGPNYTITFTGVMMLGDGSEFSARYEGPIAFAQRGSAQYERFDKAQHIEFDHSQGRYWGGWFYPFSDDLSLEFFQGEFDENNTLKKGYYLHLGTFYMPKYADYNATNIPLAEGTYSVRGEKQSMVGYFAQPYFFEPGSVEDLYGSQHYVGVYVTYTDKDLNVNKIGLVKDGAFTVTGEGDDTRLEFNFLTEEGVAITGSYSGNLNLMNYNDNDQQSLWSSRPWTSLEEDHTYNFPEDAVCDAFLLGDYVKEGQDNWLLMLCAYDAQGAPYGDYFTTELMVPSSNGYHFPTGTFEISWETEGSVMLPGFLDYGGSVLFTFYGDLTLDEDGYSLHSAPIASGTVTISEEGENYHFLFDMVDDGGHRITGSWSGPVMTEDLREAMSESDDPGHTHSLARQPLRR